MKERLGLTAVLRAQWDRALAICASVAGVTSLVAGWLGVSGTGKPAEQIPFVVSGGIGSVILFGIGGMLWLSADLRDEWRKLDRLEELLGKEHPVVALDSDRAVAEPAEARSGR